MDEQSNRPWVQRVVTLPGKHRALFWGAAFLAAAGMGWALLPGVAGGQEEKSGVREEVAATNTTSITRVVLAADRLSCGSCEDRIHDALERYPNVRAVAVDLAARTVAVDYTTGSLDPKDLALTITRLGYPARFVSVGPGVDPPFPKRKRERSGGCGGGCCDRG